jgi:hypothetical protein
MTVPHAKTYAHMRVRCVNQSHSFLCYSFNNRGELSYLSWFAPTRTSSMGLLDAIHFCFGISEIDLFMGLFSGSHTMAAGHAAEAVRGLRSALADLTVTVCILHVVSRKPSGFRARAAWAFGGGPACAPRHG